MTKEIVKFEDWEKIDLRVGKIIKVEDIEGADKLYKMIINVGEELGNKIVCAGLKEYYSKEDLQDKKVILFVNLTPRKLRGIESQGMVLATSDSEHSNVRLLQPDGRIGVGAKVS